MSKIEEKINHVTTSINDIQEQIHLTLSDMYDEFYEHTIEDLDKKISYMEFFISCKWSFKLHSVLGETPNS